MSWPLQQQGASGETVRTVQYLLNAQGATLTVDGVFGPMTSAAVSVFQSSNGLVADGIVGDATWPLLIAPVASGSSGDVVRAVQSQLNARSGQLAVDGSFSAATMNAVQMFQAPIGLTVDGIVSWYTWQALVTDFLRTQGSQACSQSVYQAWASSDQIAAAYNAGPLALVSLFARPWSASDSWTFQKCGVATGHWVCLWNNASGGTLSLEGTETTYALYYCVTDVTFGP